MYSLKAFYFEIIKHRLTRSAKTIQRVPFPQLPPIVTSYITIVHIKTKKLTLALLTRLQPLFSFHHFLNLNSFFFFWLHLRACGILLGAEPTHPAALEVQSPKHWPAREVPICIHLYVCSSVYLYPFLDSYNYQYNQGTELFHHHKRIPLLPGNTSLYTDPLLSPGNQCSLSEF